jgi:hypothetical protein
MELLTGIFSAFGLSASAGLNAYIPLLVVALITRYTDWFTLNKPWDVLGNGWVIGLLVVLSTIEFFADKIPAVNHINDVIQTLIRPVAGAIVFAASAKVVTNIHPVLSLACGLFVAGSVHAVKSAAVRPAVTATTAGAGNIPVSIAEDLVATIVSIMAAVVPVLISALIVLITAWIIWLIWRRINRERNIKLLT